MKNPNQFLHEFMFEHIWGEYCSTSHIWEYYPNYPIRRFYRS